MSKAVMGEGFYNYLVANAPDSVAAIKEAYFSGWGDCRSVVKEMVKKAASSTKVPGFSSDTEILRSILEELSKL